MKIFSVDLRDVSIIECLQLHQRLEGAVSFHLKIDMVCIMAAGKQKGLKRLD